MNDIKLKLSAGILNSEREAEIYDWLKLVAPDYTGQFNKRFETWINKQASDRFGTKTIKNWGMNGEDKTYPKVNFYMHKDQYQLSDVAKFEFRFNYDGKTVGYDYETKTNVMRDHNESESLFGISSVEDIVNWAIKCATNRRENAEQMKANLKDLPKLEQERLELTAKVEAYNKKINYIISDEMRIK